MIELWCCLHIVQRLHVNDEIIVSLASDYGKGSMYLLSL